MGKVAAAPDVGLSWRVVVSPGNLGERDRRREPSGVAARRCGDGRGVARPVLGPLGHAAAGSSLVVAHSAENAAGVRIPSAECGRLRL